ncbi:MAG: serine/threonine protein kinase [Planctomycetota bacterium]|jgi:serine/threonine-protein kinase|nr:serine/threonine protein kinase [Planctomycetota bacterium]
MNESLAHIDQRLGHVAVDMGLMNPLQVEEARREMLRARAEGGGPDDSLGAAAVRLGFIDNGQLGELRAEELRRRRLITGYEIVDRIGSGTIATVYRAVQVAMDREVALKILHPRLATDPVFVNAYIAEARAVSRFHHPHIVQGIDVGESNGFYYFAHEYLSGGSLGSQLARHGPLSENQALLHLRQTVSGLRHAWEAAVFHGDLNPGNLLLDAQGDVKLANLGVPRVARPKEAQVGLRPGFVRCGPEYAAPEQLAQPELVNAATDIYSLGASFYHLSFGVPPFDPGDVEDGNAVIRFRESRPVPPFAPEAVSRFSPKFVNLIRDMLELDPARRPRNPDELSQRLEKFHLAGAGEWSGLVRQAGPVAATGKARSARSFAAVPAPSPESVRGISLVRRKKSARSGFGGWLWVGIAFLSLAVLLLLYRFLGIAD